MKSKAKLIFSRTMWMLLFVLIAQPIAHGVFWLSGHIYSALNEWLGSQLFPLFSPISDAEGYRVYLAVLWLISYVIALTLSVYLSLSHSNERCEWVISKTEGFFTLPELYPVYLRRYALCDLTSSLIAPAPLLIISSLLPEAFYDTGFSFLFEFTFIVLFF